ncbi:MAG: hypothetical protein MR913_02300 [Clostridiales bacterium]|nr:hypothetical protein [Clostridiales bacterium]
MNRRELTAVDFIPKKVCKIKITSPASVNRLPGFTVFTSVPHSGGFSHSCHRTVLSTPNGATITARIVSGDPLLSLPSRRQ